MSHRIPFALFAALFLVGFGMAAVTAGAPAAVACGTLGFLGLLGVIGASVEAEQPPAGHRTASMRR